MKTPRATFRYGLWLLVGALFFGSPATVFAETGRFNGYLSTGVSHFAAHWQGRELGWGAAASGAAEWALSRRWGVELRGGMVRHFAQVRAEGYRPQDGAFAAWAGAGLRLRIHDDDRGYRFAWRADENHTGNWDGNLSTALGALAVFTDGLVRPALQVEVSYAFSAINGLQVGPLLQGTWVYQPNGINVRDRADAWLVVAGLVVQVAVPSRARTIPDTDRDGLRDPRDPCPAAPEDNDGFQDGDGCPDDDNDQDGILDPDDQCPNVAEDNDGFQDDDGCPDDDNDQDGILDPNDQCPDEAEDEDGFQDDDGCPDDDNDQDGILDANDDCPDEPEVVNGVTDADGCPDTAMVRVHERRILGGENIYFEFGSARILRKSDLYLRQLVRLLEAHPEYTKISIEGHTDRVGPTWVNDRLGYERAKRVAQRLVELGVAPERLTVVSYGESRPAVEDYGWEERAANRRVEFYIVEIAETPAPPTEQETEP